MSIFVQNYMDSEKKIWKYTSKVVLKVYMSLIKGKGKAKRRQAKGEKNLYSLKCIITWALICKTYIYIYTYMHIYTLHICVYTYKWYLECPKYALY